MSGLISPLAADIVGIIGSILFISAFAYANAAKELNKLWFNVANLAGAILLLISLSVHFNLAAFLLEAAWAVIALFGIANALLVRKAAPLPLAGGGLASTVPWTEPEGEPGESVFDADSPSPNSSRKREGN